MSWYITDPQYDGNCSKKYLVMISAGYATNLGAQRQQGSRRVIKNDYRAVLGSLAAWFPLPKIHVRTDQERSQVKSNLFAATMPVTQAGATCSLIVDALGATRNRRSPGPCQGSLGMLGNLFLLAALGLLSR